MTTLFKIPLQNTPQSFEVELEGRTLQCVCRWNDAVEGGWFLDISENDAPVVMNLPLVTGCNLIEQYPELGMTGVFAILTDGGDDAPTLDNLGVDSNLYYLSAS